MLQQARQIKGTAIAVHKEYPGGVGALHDSIRHQGAVRVLGFGRYYKGEEQDWTFRHLKTPSDATIDCSINRHLPDIATAIGEKDLFVPSPEFGVRAVTRWMLNTRIVLRRDPIVVHRGTAGDIAVLSPGESFAISVGGCAVAYVYCPYKPTYRLVVGHAARQNLETIAEKMWEVAQLPAFDLSRVHVGICFPIDPSNFEHRFDHVDFGSANQALCERLVEQWGEESVLGWSDPEQRKLGRIDIGWVLRRQFAKLGVPSNNIHATPSYDIYRGPKGEPLWYTTRGLAGEEQRRNLVIVSHRHTAAV